MIAVFRKVIDYTKSDLKFRLNDLTIKKLRQANKTTVTLKSKSFRCPSKVHYKVLNFKLLVKRTTS